MRQVIKQSILTSELKEQVNKIFTEQAIESTGGDDLVEDSIAFEMHEKDGKFIGCIVVRMFWGQLHIKNLVVDKKYRGYGYGKKLMEIALEYGKKQGCNFSFVETMSFQAPEFYQNLGFKLELKRDGYSRGTSFCYLKRDL
jgi:ribosomal protein S18 acetylase RimI-like enzyme